MKKLIAIALAGILAATAAYTAIAADEDDFFAEFDAEEVTSATVGEPAAEDPAAEEPTTEAGATMEDILAALEGDAQAQEIVEKYGEKIRSGATTEDVNALLEEIAEYINSKGYDVADIKNDKEKAKQFAGDFLEDCGVDSELLGQALDGAGEIFDSIFGTGETGAEAAVDTGADGSYDGSSIDYGVESTTIPDTGYIG